MTATTPFRDRYYIEQICKIAGFPPPVFSANHATIKVSIGTNRGKIPTQRLAALQNLPELSAETFDKWCHPFGLTPIARFLNQELGTKYGPSDVWKLRKGHRKIPWSIRALVARTPHPYDPQLPS